MLLSFLFPLFLPRSNQFTEFSLLITKLSSPFEILITNRCFLLLSNLSKLVLEPFNLRWRDLASDPGASTRFIDDINRLIGKEAIRDVAVSKLSCMFKCIIRNHNAMMVLVVTPQTPEYLDCLLNYRGIHNHRLETPF